MLQNGILNFANRLSQSPVITFQIYNLHLRKREFLKRGLAVKGLNKKMILLLLLFFVKRREESLQTKQINLWKTDWLIQRLNLVLSFHFLSLWIRRKGTRLAGNYRGGNLQVTFWLFEFSRSKKLIARDTCLW